MSFAVKAFEYADKYRDDGVKLFYNDFNEYMPNKTDGIVSFIREVYENGHIDGMGMQSHLDIEGPAVSDISDAIDSFASVGTDFEIQITELDITTYAGNLEAQETMYEDIMKMLIQKKKNGVNITGVTFWGLNDEASWRADGQPLLFSTNSLLPKDVYYMVLAVPELLKEDTIVTVTEPTSITYGEELENPSADTDIPVANARYTYQYSGALADSNNTVYDSIDKPYEPGTYTVTATLVSGTHKGTSTPTGFTIHKKDLNWTTDGIVNDKTYDRTMSATIKIQPTLDDIINNDTIVVQNGMATFDTANAGSSIVVTANGYSVTGEDSWKYNAPSGQPSFNSGTIDPKVTTFTVAPIDRQLYIGKELTPAIVVKDGGVELIQHTDYEANYKNHTNVGTANVTVNGKGNYEGSVGSANFTISKAAVSNTAKAAQTVTYNGNAIDLGTLFTIDKNAGTCTYIIEKSGTTGVGTINSGKLTVTKAGVFKVAMTTAANNTYNAGAKVIATLTVNKATQNAPRKPSVSKKTINSVTLKAVAGAEYSKDNKKWQSASMFKGLKPNTTYKFYVRLKSTDVKNASSASAALSVKTNQATVASPKVSKKAGTYKRKVTVKLTCATKNAKIYYTLNGKKPTIKSKFVKSGKSIAIKKNTTLKIMAAVNGCKNSKVVTIRYKIKK